MVKKLLVVDDNADIRKVIVAALSHKRYKIVEAENGNAAIKKLHAERFDLLITNYKMPGADGLEIIEEALSLYQKMPVIFVSGSLSPEVRARAERLVPHDN